MIIIFNLLNPRPTPCFNSFVLQEFCSVLLSHFSALSWSFDTILLALNALRIFTREHEGSDQLVSPLGLVPLINLAGLDKDYAGTKEFFSNKDIPEGQIEGENSRYTLAGVHTKNDWAFCRVIILIQRKH